MPSAEETRIRCPVDEIGKNSVTPSTAPRIMLCNRSIGESYHEPIRPIDNILSICYGGKTEVVIRYFGLQPMTTIVGALMGFLLLSGAMSALPAQASAPTLPNYAVTLTA